MSNRWMNVTTLENGDAVVTFTSRTASKAMAPLMHTLEAVWDCGYGGYHVPARYTDLLKLL